MGDPNSKTAIKTFASFLMTAAISISIKKLVDIAGLEAGTHQFHLMYFYITMTRNTN